MGLWSRGKGVTGECLVPWAGILRGTFLYNGVSLHWMSKHQALSAGVPLSARGGVKTNTGEQFWFLGLEVIVYLPWFWFDVRVYL